MTEQNEKSGREIDEISGTETTGHDWDGIKELDTPAPRWWLWTFYATIIFSIGYVIYFPAIPLITTATKGVSGITTRGELAKVMAGVDASRDAQLKRIKSMPIEQVIADQELYRFAVAGGKSLFKINCTPCHGSGAQGGPGYPNLNDDDWLWGGDPKSIYISIAHGIRDTADENARTSQMPAFGDDQILEPAQIATVTEFVLKLSGVAHNESMAQKGAPVFADNCASCHGPKGKGMHELGAPNLADALSLYGTSRALVNRQITKPRHGVMPPWLKRLGDANVKQLASYVYSLGGGEKIKPAQ